MGASHGSRGVVARRAGTVASIASMLVAIASAAEGCFGAESASSARADGGETDTGAALDGADSGSASRRSRCTPTSQAPARDTKSCSIALGDRDHQFVSSVSLDGLGNIFVAGRLAFEVAGWSSPSETAFVAKLDPACQLSWTRKVEGAAMPLPGDPAWFAADPAPLARADCAGSVFLIGQETSTGSTRAMGAVRKLDSSGTDLWKVALGDAVPSFADVDGKGDVVFAGAYPCGNGLSIAGGPPLPTTCVGADAGGVPYYPFYPPFVAKLDAGGRHLFSKGLPPGPSVIGLATDVAGNIVLSFSNGDLVKLAPDGTELWRRPGRQDASTATSAIATDGDDNVIAVSSSVAGRFVEKLDPSGASVWSQTLSPTMLGIDTGVGFTPAGIGGVAAGPGGEIHIAEISDSNLVLTSLRSDGTSIGTGSYGRGGVHGPMNVAVGPTGEVVIAGGFVGRDIEFGSGALENPFSWSKEPFVSRNPSYASLAGPSDPLVPPPAPTPLTPDVGGARHIAVTPTDIYWAAYAGGVYRCPLAGCAGGAPTKLFDGDLDFEIGSASVYALKKNYYPNALLRCPIAGCNGAPPTTLMEHVRTFAVISGGVYAAGFDGQLWKCTDEGTCDLLPSAKIREIVRGKSGFGFFGDKSYYCADGTQCPGPEVPGFLAPGDYNVPMITEGPVGTGIPWLQSCPSNGCGASPAVDAVWLTARVPLSFGRAYAGPNVLVTSDGRTVTACAPASCAGGRIVVGGNVGGDNLVSDGANVYFYSPSKPGVVPPWYSPPTQRGRILRCPLTGCPSEGPTIVATEVDNSPFVLDDTSVYFAGAPSGGTRLYKAPK